MELIKLKYRFAFVVFKLVSPIKLWVDKVYNWSVATGFDNLIVDFNRINEIVKQTREPLLAVPVKIGVLDIENLRNKENLK